MMQWWDVMQIHSLSQIVYLSVINRSAADIWSAPSPCFHLSTRATMQLQYFIRKQIHPSVERILWDSIPAATGVKERVHTWTGHLPITVTCVHPLICQKFRMRGKKKIPHRHLKLQQLSVCSLHTESKWCEASVTQAWTLKSSLGLRLFCLLSRLGHLCLTRDNPVLSWRSRAPQENIMQSRFNWLVFFFCTHIDPAAACVSWLGRWGHMFYNHHRTH